MKRILLICLIALVSVTLAAKKITGNVHCGEQMLQGVTVTDGVHFATTDRDGFFRLKIDKNSRFVYIVTPSGYTADYSSGAPAFYQKLSKKTFYPFAVYQTKPGSDYTLFSVSDPQMANEKHFKKFSAEPLKDLITMAASKSAEHLTVGVALGDIGWNNLDPQTMYKDAIRRTGIPFYAVIGNHDFIQNLPSPEANATFEDRFGPLNWAVWIGKDLLIGVCDILFKGGAETALRTGKYEEGYSDETLAFVKNVLANVPKGTHVFMAQHSPIFIWQRDSYIKNGEEMLALFDGYTLDILAGHTHIMNNIVHSKTIFEHNAASICGAWWTTTVCKDGTPRGYEIFDNYGDSLSWHWHNIDLPDDRQVEFIDLGQSMYHPNSALANVWDYDPDWKVEWWQDGQYMGDAVKVPDVSPTYIKAINEAFEKSGKEIPRYKRPRRNIHYFAANPTSQYAGKIDFKVTAPDGREWTHTSVMEHGYIDVQAHRGGAGLMPENTLSSMANAIALGVNTLELDLHVSRDSQVVVSHDAYFHSRYTTRPDGTLIQKGEPHEYLWTMPYDSITRYDVGLRPNTVWPDQKKVAEVKPLAKDLIEFCEKQAAEKHLSPFRYNIEIKSREGEGEGRDWPEYRTFVDLCIPVIESLGDRLVVQCFDVRALEYMHEKYKDLFLSYLTDKDEPDIFKILSNLSFKPDWWSPHYSVITPENVAYCHSLGIRVVPWTIDKPEDITRMIDCGVDAIISNYPDRVLIQTRGYVR